jgi:hypothetical protein
MLEEKLKDATIGELTRQAKNSPQSLSVDPSQVKGKWNGNPEKEQRSGNANPDLEKWQENGTH